MNDMKEFERSGLIESIRNIYMDISDNMNKDEKKPNASARKRIRVKSMDLVRAAKALKTVYAEAKV
jgi:hypothetical protein